MVVLANPPEHYLVAKIPETESIKLDLGIDIENVDLLPDLDTIEPQKFDVNEYVLEKIDGPAFKIVPIACKGSGMIATRKLYPGDIILAEKPVFIVPDAIFMDVEKCEEFLGREINKCNSEERELILDLTDCRDRDPTDYFDPNPYCGFFYTNAMHFEGDACLCPIMARANHSCRPNSEFITRADIGTQHLMANYIINPGEEITINYMAMADEGADTKETRQAYLREWYGFQCTCRACTYQDNDLEEDEALREAIKELQAAGPDNLDPAELESLISKMYQIKGKHSYILDMLQQLYRSAPAGSYEMVKYAVQGYTIAVNLYGFGSKEGKEWKNQLDFQKSVNLLISLDETLPEA
eukprot:GFUD01086735.1.p1 GENE.GFUD01086735.1~~GFUD01086735.1.p1  ORF type:complete len:354 (-),score=82.93 GFUD01086735.1:105-1166(-)